MRKSQPDKTKYLEAWCLRARCLEDLVNIINATHLSKKDMVWIEKIVKASVIQLRGSMMDALTSDPQLLYPPQYAPELLKQQQVKDVDDIPF